jgi:hypothetical protein
MRMIKDWLGIYFVDFADPEQVTSLVDINPRWI